MMARQRYEMAQQQCDTLLEACKPTPVMYLPGGQRMGPTPQENANAAWRKLGAEMGFEWDTVSPIASEGPRHFTAVPTPPELTDPVASKGE